MWKFIDKAKEKYRDLPLQDDPRFMYFKCCKGGLHIRVTLVLIALLYYMVEIYVLQDKMESHAIANLVLSIFALFAFGLRKDSRNALLLFQIALAMNFIDFVVNNQIDHLFDNVGEFVLQCLRICCGACLLLIVRNYRRYILELRKLKISKRRCIDCKENLELTNAAGNETADEMKDEASKKGKTKASKKKKNEKMDSIDTKAGSEGAIARIKSMVEKLPFDMKEEFKNAALVISKEALSELTGVEETSMLIDLAVAKGAKKKSAKKCQEEKSTQTSNTWTASQESSEKVNDSKMNMSSFVTSLLFGVTMDDDEEDTESEESVLEEKDESDSKDDRKKEELDDEKYKSE